jgi:hypothetical protein
MKAQAIIELNAWHIAVDGPFVKVHANIVLRTSERDTQNEQIDILPKVSVLNFNAISLAASGNHFAASPRLPGLTAGMAASSGGNASGE